jgi:hypothetical protein
MIAPSGRDAELTRLGRSGERGCESDRMFRVIWIRRVGARMLAMTVTAGATGPSKRAAFTTAASAVSGSCGSDSSFAVRAVRWCSAAAGTSGRTVRLDSDQLDSRRWTPRELSGLRSQAERRVEVEGHCDERPQTTALARVARAGKTRWSAWESRRPHVHGQLHEGSRLEKSTESCWLRTADLTSPTQSLTTLTAPRDRSVDSAAGCCRLRPDADRNRVRARTKICADW